MLEAMVTSAEPSKGDDNRPASEKFCIIGAGPSGLAMAAEFRRLGLAYDHFERHTRLGGIWEIDNPGSPMYESAHFISSRTQSAFAGFPMPEDYPDYPRHDQILQYLRSFAAYHHVEESIRFGVEVTSVVPARGFAEVTADGEQTRYRAVVCASGVNWEPLIPEIEGTFSGELRHAVTYRSSQEFAGKRVVIVGLGNSGADIACDAARSARRAIVSVRRGYHFVPKHIFGMPADVFAHEGPHLPLWLERPLFRLLMRLLVGNTERLGMPKPNHAVLDSHPLMNDQLVHHLRHGDVELRGDVQRFDGSRVVFGDGSHVEADLVLLATGYTRRIPYLSSEFLDGSSWAAGNFLTCLSRRYDSLFTLGFAELNGALYPHLSRLSAIIGQVCHRLLHDPAAAEQFYAWLATKNFDLTGGRKLIATPRHAHYCDEHALLVASQKVLRQLGVSTKALAQVPSQRALPGAKPNPEEKPSPESSPPATPRVPAARG